MLQATSSSGGPNDHVRVMLVSHMMTQMLLAALVPGAIGRHM